MEQYIWIGNKNIIYKLNIDDNEIDRFNGEGIYQYVLLQRIEDTLIFPTEDIYETTYGRYHALNHFKNMDNDYWEDEDININDFKDWLYTSLTPLTEQRKTKITRIKSKL